MIRIEPNSISNNKDYMFNFWKRIGVAESVMETYYNHAMDESQYQRNLDIMKKHFDFKRKKTIDLGSGWGSLTYLLQKEDAEVYAIEPVLEHAQITANRCPSAYVFQEDACNLPFDNNSFDIVLSNSIVEHIDTEGKRGLSTKNDKKQAHILEMARILRPGGQGFITTGNNNFPWDGEVNKWFFHWLPAESQNKWLKSIGETADTYSFLTWPDLKNMIEGAGLTITSVENPDYEYWRPTLEKIGFRPDICDIFIDLFKNNPEFMNSWFIFFEKKSLYTEVEC